MIVTSGGIGGNHDLVRRNWPERLGDAAAAHDLRRARTTSTGACSRSRRTPARSVINPDRMWHYVEGIQQLGPDLADARHPHPARARRRCGSTRPGERLPVPLFPGFDTLGTLAHIMRTGHDHTWFVLTQKIIEKEFALSGSEQNPDLTGKSVRELLKTRVAPGRARARSRRSRSTARTSSSSATCARWSTA